MQTLENESTPARIRTQDLLNTSWMVLYTSEPVGPQQKQVCL